MKKITSILLTSLIALTAVGCSQTNSDVKGNYAINVDGFDWGAGVTKAQITLDKEIENVDITDFTVQETKKTTDWTKEDTPVVEVTNERKITNAYTTDENGEKIDGPSQYVTIEMNVDPNEGSPLLYTLATNYNTWSDPYYLEFSLTDKADITVNGENVDELIIEKEYSGKTTEADSLKINTFTGSDNVEMKYGLYEPEAKSDTLVVWLHGTGEAGTEDTDPHVTALASEVTALVENDFQETVGGASVLVPQSPTIWQDYDGKGQKWVDGLPVSDKGSYYEQSLFELIEQTKTETGASKVVVAGASGGGYMTMLLLTKHPDYFAAAIPICEAYPDNLLTEDQLEAIKDVPMYFIYSNDDASLSSDKFSKSTISRLEEAGATNLHVASSDHVIDTSEKYNYLNDGKPYQYNGHFSWIYFFNNEAESDDGETNVWEWIAEQVN